MWLLLMLACGERGVLETYPIPQLDFALDSPVYAQFVGDGPLTVSGRTGSALSVVTVEGEAVPVAEDGTFSVEVPVDHPYRIIEVTADLYDQHAEARLPVFDGRDPAETWPGGLTMRFTQRGLDGVAGTLAATVEGLVSEEALLPLIPTFDVLGWTFGPTGVTHDPVSVTLDASAEGISTDIAIQNLSFELMLSGELLFIPIEVPAVLRLPSTTIGLQITPGQDETGLFIELGDAALGFDAPTLEISSLDLSWLSDLLLGAIDIGALLTDVIDGVLGEGTRISLGSAAPLPIDLLGFSLELRAADVFADDLGVGLGFSVGLDEPSAAEMPAMPYPDGQGAVDLDVAVHEAMLQPLVQSELLALLDQDLTLPGFLGIFLEQIVRAVPGGDQAPSDAAGWCVGLKPGDARVVRFREGADPLIGVYLPDATVKFGYLAPGSSVCSDWLVASMALEVGLVVTEGTVLAFDLAAPEGAVVSYGATGWEEEAVITGLSGSITSLLGLFGGLIQIDLAEILDLEALLGGLSEGLGAELPPLDLRIGEARPAVGVDGQPIDGLWQVGVQLFAE
jgi:hypothetical protein